MNSKGLALKKHSIPFKSKLKILENKYQEGKLLQIITQK